MTIMTPMQPITEAFKGVHNFRDFGGYSVPGGRIRNGLLYRSAHYAEATDEDLATFAGMKMAAIIDLRRPTERVKYPTRRHAECAAKLIAYGDPTTATEAPHLLFLGEEGITQEILSQRMIKIYREFAFEPGHITVFGDAFRTLAEVDGPVVVHCHAGKDRTGLIVSLIHHVLGVEREDLLNDYLATNEVSRIEQRLPDMIATFKETTGIEPPAALLRHIWRVDTSYLDAAYDAIIAAHGSVDAYLTDRLGITPAMQQTIRERLIEPA